MANSLYSNYLDFAPTFRWGGREWGAGDQAAFMRALGPKRYAKWARRHRTAARVFDPVEQEIYGAYQPQLAAMDRERKRQQDYYKTLMQNLGGFAGALGPLLAPHAGVVRDAYNSGAATMQSGGDMYGGQLNADQAANAAAGNKTLAAIDSPAQLAGGDAGSVLAGAAGWIPATMMGAQGAAWAERMGHLPTEAALQANLMMKDLLDEAKDADSEFSGKISDVLAGLAGDRVKLTQDFEDRRLAQIDAQREYALKQMAIAQAAGKQADYNYWKKKAYQLDLRQQNAYENKLKGLDPDGNLLPGYGYKNGKVVKLPTSSSKKKGAKGADWGDIQHDMAGETFTVKGPDPDRPWSSTQIDIPMTYKQAFQMLWAKYSGLVSNKGRLRRLINQVLASNGIKKPKSASTTDPNWGQH